VYIGQYLAKGKAPEDERYADWIQQYASDEFAQAAEWLRAELDRVAAGAGDEKHARLTELFVISSRYEWQFWEMCWNGEEWGP
jgi:thiaminase/transcriptional activator TenA